MNKITEHNELTRTRRYSPITFLAGIVVLVNIFVHFPRFDFASHRLYFRNKLPIAKILNKQLFSLLIDHKKYSKFKPLAKYLSCIQFF